LGVELHSDSWYGVVAQHIQGVRCEVHSSYPVQHRTVILVAATLKCGIASWALVRCSCESNCKHGQKSRHPEHAAEVRTWKLAKTLPRIQAL
jgi:hypothetical protein